jgi:hypothetical protein
MSPVPGPHFDPSAPATLFRNEWKNPSNYAFTILLLLGGDVVARALAQLAGGRLTPVAFSFGTNCILYKLLKNTLSSAMLMFAGADIP